MRTVVDNFLVVIVKSVTLSWIWIVLWHNFKIAQMDSFQMQINNSKLEHLFCAISRLNELFQVSCRYNVAAPSAGYQAFIIKLWFPWYYFYNVIKSKCLYYRFTSNIRLGLNVNQDWKLLNATEKINKIHFCVQQLIRSEVEFVRHVTAELN